MGYLLTGTREKHRMALPGRVCGAAGYLWQQQVSCVFPALLPAGSAGGSVGNGRGGARERIERVCPA